MNRRETILILFGPAITIWLITMTLWSIRVTDRITTVEAGVQACVNTVSALQDEVLRLGHQQVPDKPVLVTAYCDSGTTSSGLPAGVGIAAVSRGLYPRGTVLLLSGGGEGERIVYVGDTIPERTAKRWAARGEPRVIDIYTPDCAAAREWGKKRMMVSVVGRKP